MNTFMCVGLCISLSLSLLVSGVQENITVALNSAREFGHKFSNSLAIGKPQIGLFLHKPFNSKHVKINYKTKEIVKKLPDSFCKILLATP